MIRKNSSIKGLEICGHLFNIIAYANDATILCRNLDSVKQLKPTFDKFSKYSGLLLNSSKTEIWGQEGGRGCTLWNEISEFADRICYDFRDSLFL